MANLLSNPAGDVVLKWVYNVICIEMAGKTQHNIEMFFFMQ